MNTAVHFSSKTDEWSTPQATFDALNAEFGFTLDVCANRDNAKCPYWYSLEAGDDGLKQDWAESAKRMAQTDYAGRCAVWMNPPYGREIGKWVRKAREESEKGATVVCLLPARTDTKWWHDDVQGRAEIRFIKGRLKFGGSKNSAPFPSVVVVFRPGGKP